MKEQLISFETAKLAKEKDFNILQHSYYFEDGEFKENSLKGTNGYYGEEYEFNLSEFNENWNDKWLTKKTGDRCFGCSKQKGYLETFLAPTQSLLQKWLREVKGENITPPLFFSYQGYACDIMGFENTKYFKTYEEALENELYECLQRVSETVA